MFPFKILESIPGGIPDPTAPLLRPIWSDLVGKELGDHTSPISVRGGVVVVEAARPWDVALSQMSKDVVWALNRGTPWTFTSLDIIPVAPAPVEASASIDPKPRVEPTHTSIEALDEIEDDAIRQLSERILRRVANGD